MKMTESSPKGQHNFGLDQTERNYRRKFESGSNDRICVVLLVTSNFSSPPPPPPPPQGFQETFIKDT